MPGLIACGRRWDIGSDDLVFPGVGENVLRFGWLLVVSIVYHLHKDQPPSCSTGTELEVFYIGFIVLLCVHIAFNLVIIYISMQGSITDTAARRRMPRLLYVKLGLFLPELAWLVLGTYWAFRESSGCDWYIVATVKFVAVTGWIMTLIVLAAIGIIFDPLGSRHPQLHQEEHEEDLGIASKRLWERRCRLLCCCAGCDEQSQEAFNDIAHLFTHYFEGLDLVPTDIAAGLMLLQQEQKNQPRTMKLVPIPPSPRRSQVNGRTLTLPRDITDRPPSPLMQAMQQSPPSPSEAEHTAVVHQGEDSPARLHLEPASESSEYPQAKAWMDIEFVAHYMKFAMASYGWPLFMFSHLCTGCCRLWSDCKCCACACRQSGDWVLDDNCCQCHTAAIKNTTGVIEEDIVYASFYNRVYEIPFYIALDHHYCCVVVSVRGTLSLRDALTDLSADSERVDVPGVDHAKAHKGILNAALYIKHKLESMRLLETAFRKAQGYGLVITGHSLGAGAASLLAVLLRPNYPQLICYAYSPPGGLLSLDLSRYTEEFVCSVVLGKDLVPRLSLITMEDLKARVLRVIKDCHQPKYQVLASGCLRAACGSPSAENVESVEDRASRRPLLEESGSGTCSVPIYTGSQADMEQTLQDAIVSSNRSRITHEPLYPPGHIMYIDEVEPASGCCGLPTYEAAWARAEAFSEIVVGPKMVTDHLPDAVMGALEQLAGRNVNPSYLVQLEQHNPIT